MRTTERDKEALERALAGQLEAERVRPPPNEGCDGQLKRGVAWREVAEHAAYEQQVNNLGLRPWEDPPMWGDPQDDDDASNLLSKMRKLGISKYEPDPARAIAAAADVKP
jgi:hypothetical protein